MCNFTFSLDSSYTTFYPDVYDDDQNLITPAYSVFTTVIEDIPEPIGWDNIAFTLRKDTNYEGIFYERSGELKFYELSRDIIIRELRKKHFEAKIIFNVYDGGVPFFTGRLNLANYSDDECIFSCNIDSLDLSIEFLNNAERKEDMLEVVPLQTIDIPALILKNKAVLGFDQIYRISGTTVDAGFYVDFSETHTDSVDFDLYWIWEYDSVNERTQLRCLKACTVSVYVPAVTLSYSNHQCINMGGTNYFPSGYGGLFVGNYLQIFETNNGTPSIPATESYASAKTVIQSYVAGDVFIVDVALGYNPPPTTGCDSVIPVFDGATISVDSVNKPVTMSFLSDPYNSPDTQGAWVFDALKHSINKASNGKLGFVSNYFGKPSQGYATTGCGALRILASGYLVRTISKFQASFKDIFDGLRDISNLALSFEKDGLGNDVVRIEPKDAFFDNTSIAFECFDVADVKFTLATNKIIKLIDIGYSKWQTEYAQGINEFNANNQYESTNITQHKTSKKAVSSLIAGSYSIEKQRRKQFEKGIDSPEDDNIYIFCVKDSASNVSPIFEQTNTEKYMNLRIAPERNLLHYRREIASGTVFGVSGFLRLKSKAAAAQPSDLVETVTNNFTLRDGCDTYGSDSYGALALLSLLTNFGYGSNVPSTTTTPLYLPIFAEFEYPMSMSEFLSLRSLTRKRISFTTCCEFLRYSNLTTYYGYIEEVKYKPNEGVAEMKLLLAP